MKRTIFVEILLLLVLAVLLAIGIAHWQSVSSWLNLYFEDFHNDYTWNEFVKEFAFDKTLTYSIFTLVATIADLVAIILIAIKDFPVFKPLLDKLAANKERRTQAKAERAEADKQAKIKALEAELEELKND